MGFVFVGDVVVVLRVVEDNVLDPLSLVFRGQCPRVSNELQRHVAPHPRLLGSQKPYPECSTHQGEHTGYRVCGPRARGCAATSHPRSVAPPASSEARVVTRVLHGPGCASTRDAVGTRMYTGVLRDRRGGAYVYSKYEPLTFISIYSFSSCF